jgi:hypothetical protein
MKRKELIKRLIDAGCVFVRPGARHDLYMNPKTGKAGCAQTSGDRRESCKTYFEALDLTIYYKGRLTAAADFRHVRGAWHRAYGVEVLLPGVSLS